MNSFRNRFREGARLIGAFVKTPAHATIEILSATGLDYVVIDAEHAPFNPETVDRMLLAAQARSLPALVRVPDMSAILGVLDCGADGVLVPHIASAERAQAMVASCRYRGGSRGFSPSGRAGSYGGVKQSAHIAAEDARVTAIAMIEDPEALDEIEAIVATPGLDGIFIGRGDLSTAMGAENQTAPQVTAAVAKIIAAGRAAGLPVMMMVANLELLRSYADMGATCFLIGSDQSFLKSGTRDAVSAATAKIG